MVLPVVCNCSLFSTIHFIITVHNPLVVLSKYPHDSMRQSSTFFCHMGFTYDSKKSTTQLANITTKKGFIRMHLVS